MEIYAMGHFVECPKVKPLALVPVAECRKCEFHDSVRRVREETPGKCPALFDVLCRLPRAQRVHNAVTSDEALADLTAPRLMIEGEVADRGGA